MRRYKIFEAGNNMRLVILALFASIAGFGLFQVGKLDPDNYVKMYLGGYLVEVKILGFILLLIAIVAVLYFALWLLRTIWRSPKTFARWRGQKNHDKAEQQFGAGYLSLIKGDWHKAENLLLKKSTHSGIPYANYLAAAQAAQEQGRIVSRDEYIKAAYDSAPQERLAIGLVKAKLHQQAGQMEQALATLNDLGEEGKKNPQFIAMLLQTYEHDENWQAAENLLPKAKKLKVLPTPLLNEIQSKISTDALLASSDIDSTWKNLPKAQKQKPSNVAIYAKGLIEKGDEKGAEKLISSTLKQNWDEALVGLYGSLPSDKPAKLLRKVEGWLMARPENAELNLAAGRLAAADKDYEKAKGFLQTAIHLGQLPQAYGVLGEVYEASNDNDEALKLYRAGMQTLSNGSNSAVNEKLLGMQELDQDLKEEKEEEALKQENETAKEGELV